MSFYFEPDLSAGSFRNSSLATELANQLMGQGSIDVITTIPNRYSSFDISAPKFEQRDNINIYRISVPGHRSGFVDQIGTFNSYFSGAKKIAAENKYDLVFASSSRLFTAYLGYKIAKKQKKPLYLDIRDIFTDTMQEVLKNSLVRSIVIPVLKQIETKVFNYASHINLISGGFEPYFVKYKRPAYSVFSNGIDPEFLEVSPSRTHSGPKVITYAGNIGEGQGLHKIIPQSAKKLGPEYQFIVIGDGGAKQKLLDQIIQIGVKNVEMRKPVSREELLQFYKASDFLFIHLNDYNAFKKVLPSKVFELGAYDKPIIAGVAGFANNFITNQISNCIVFLPADVDDFVKKVKNYVYKTEFRKEFIDKYKRENINKQMAMNILSYLK
ncbi:MAG TPA: glycosyltransferase family 4 protein [Saprospiraceae bacterium]|nr:glycosyltransferase family 4 protein [Saprospiraceae bacterium]